MTALTIVLISVLAIMLLTLSASWVCAGAVKREMGLTWKQFFELARTPVAALAVDHLIFILVAVATWLSMVG